MSEIPNYSTDSQPNNPHDKLFKKFLSDKSVAKELLESYLPEDFKNLCNLDSLTVTPSSFIEENFKSQFSDMLYAIETKNGETGFVYCLIEHQSTPDKLIAFRLIRYTISAIQQYLEQQKSQKIKNPKLPLICPILFYSGKKQHPKSISLNWFDLFDNPEQAQQVYTSPFLLVDVNAIDDDEIKQHKRVGLMMYLMKHIHARDQYRLHQLIDAYFHYFIAQILSKELLDMGLFYIYNNASISDPNEFIHYIEEKSKQCGGDPMNLAQYLHETGFEKGILQGVEQGKQEGILMGRQQAKIETIQSIALNMLQKGSDVEFIRSVTGLTTEEIQKLQS